MALCLWRNFADVKRNVLFLGFNTERDRVIVGTKSGFQVFSVDPVNPVAGAELRRGIGVACPLNQTNLFALTGGGDEPFKGISTVCLFDDHARRIVLDISFTAEVVYTCFTDLFLAVATKKQLFIYKLQRDELNHIVPGRPDSYETSDVSGRYCVSADRVHPAIAFPGPDRSMVTVLVPSKRLTVQLRTSVEDEVGCIALNHDGTLVAVAGMRGKLIRVFEVATAKFLKELRRGSTEAVIYSIAFNRKSDRLCCISNHGTLHLFALDLPAITPLSVDTVAMAGTATTTAAAGAAAPAPAPAAAAAAAAEDAGGVASKLSAWGSSLASMSVSVFQYVKSKTLSVAGGAAAESPQQPQPGVVQTVSSSEDTEQPVYGSFSEHGTPLGQAQSAARAPPSPSQSDFHNTKSIFSVLAPIARELDSEWAAAKYHFNDTEPVPSLVTFSTKGETEAILVFRANGGWFRLLPGRGTIMLDNTGSLFDARY